MSSFNGIDLVLLMLGLVATYGWWMERQGVQKTWERGYVSGWSDATLKHVDALLRPVAERDNKVYDWKVDGL